MLTGIVGMVGLNAMMIVAFVIYDTITDRPKK